MKEVDLAEKWRRFSNPQSIEDYGLSMSFDEIRQVPSAMAEVNSYLPFEHQIKEETETK